MRGRIDPHAPIRELLAARLDRQLTRAEWRQLNGHLRRCGACQQTDRQYRLQRAELRSLPPVYPPRDLWARTSAALDHEVGRSYRARRWARRAMAARRSAQRATGFVALVAALGMITAVGVLQLAPAVTPPSNGSDGRVAGLPTPFAIIPQPFAFVGLGPSNIALYQTSVNQVCPPTATLDCVATETISRTPVLLPADFRGGNIALSPSGRTLALVGRSDTANVIAIVMMPTPSPDGVAAEPPRETAMPPVAPETPTPTDATASPAATEAAATPVEPDATPTPSEPVASAEPTPSATPADTDTPPPATPSQSTATLTPGQPTPASATPSVAPTSPRSASPSIATSTPTPSASPSDAAPSGPPASAVPGLAVLSILDNVHAVGAPPAWSPNGETLAFSAMPVDGSHGPDVYVWSPDDTRAQPITSDHGSFFASWSGNRIVFSRIATDQSGTAVPKTFVIDPGTLEVRAVRGGLIWLPTVNPRTGQAVAWSGVLAPSSGLPASGAGALYLLDWAKFDPFGPDAAANAGSEPVLTPLDPGRDAHSAPVVDWQARWSNDGQVLGVWIADSRGSSWGRLSVLAVDPQTHLIRTKDPLLPATLARRGFTLGVSRVAWVGPSDENVDGELRIRSWGADGVGGLRLKAPGEGEFLPAF